MKAQSAVLALCLGCLLYSLAPPSASAFYDPSIQRWINRDPIGERGGVNLQQFVKNGPVNWRDAFGYAAAPFGNPAPPPPYTRVQCDGKGRLEIAWNPRDVGTPWEHCTRAHEQQHIEDIQDSFGAGICEGIPQGESPLTGPDYDEFWRNTECQANRVGLSCIKGTCFPAPVDYAAIQRQIEAYEVALRYWRCD